MRTTLLISVAAIALTAASFASAQTQNRAPAGPSAAPSVNAPSPGSATETVNPSDHQKGAKGTQDQSGPQKQQRTTQQPNKGTGTAQTEQEQKNQPRSSQSDTKQQPNTGAAQNNQGTPSNNQGTTQNTPRGTTPNNAQGTTQNNAPGVAPSNNTQNNQATSNRSMTTSNVSLTTEQKTTIRTKVLTSSAPRVTNVDFEIRVGIAVPRTVRVAPLPVEIIEIQPTWRGYMYFVRGDEIIVVEPNTLRIVAVLEV
jgi:hypothetical protein